MTVARRFTYRFTVMTFAAILLTTLITLSSPVQTVVAATPNSQTSARPPASSLNTQMRRLWRAIVTNSPNLGAQVFFPKSAYVDMKTGMIGDPQGDFDHRLLAFFNLDLPAYHAVTGSHAVLLRVIANLNSARWISPGACENKIGYWHLPGVRLAFRHQGHVESFIVASLISWHGVWFVVHLGPNPRPINIGTVDGLIRGYGSAPPPGGC